LIHSKEYRHFVVLQVFPKNEHTKLQRVEQIYSIHSNGNRQILDIVFLLHKYILYSCLINFWYAFGTYSAYIRYIFEYQAPKIYYLNMNILFYCYSVKLLIMNIFIFIFNPKFDIHVTLKLHIEQALPVKN
jgi:hypothetical protein